MSGVKADHCPFVREMNGQPAERVACAGRTHPSVATIRNPATHLGGNPRIAPNGNTPMSRQSAVVQRVLSLCAVLAITVAADPGPSLTPGPSEDRGVEVVARKIIDADGDPGSVDDQTVGAGWEFDLGVSDGDIVVASPITNADGTASWLVSPGPDGTSVTITEVTQEDFELVDAVCRRVGEIGSGPVGRVDGGSVTFQIPEGDAATYECDFVNVPTGTSLAGISVWMHLDTDGDLDTVGDLVWPRSWEFMATFEDGVEIVSADPATDRDEPAGWLIKHEGDATRVVISQVALDGYRLGAALCIDGDSSDGMEVPTTVAGNSVTLDVQGFAPFVQFPHEYLCDFVNVSVGNAALLTPPPTDAASGSRALEPASWRLILVWLAAVVTSLLVLRSRRVVAGRAKH
jgi:hypothetical protein